MQFQADYTMRVRNSQAIGLPLPVQQIKDTGKQAMRLSHRILLTGRLYACQNPDS
jgi:hypothetical protein